MKGGILAHGIASQMLACMYTLMDCITRCPKEEWNESHNDYPYSQVVFHILFDLDLSLSGNKDELLGQAFHLENQKTFAEYEELEDRPRTGLYGREFIKRYYDHCLGKIKSIVETQCDEDLLVPNGDFYGNMTKAERYINAIRHMQHHVAQLGLRLQYLSGQEMGWVSRGYDS
jgi:hypothetical protein